MGFASSSAARVAETPMFGNLGSPGGMRKLKKKPVLVLDPEELAKAHHLFQIGAAEQINEYDPLARAPRTAPVFAVVLGGALDDDDDYQPPVSMADMADEEGEATDDDLPPIDLAAMLAMTEAEQREEDAYYAAIPEVELAEAETAEAAEPAPEPAHEDAPADALARIVSRAAAMPAPSAAEPEPAEPDCAPVWQEPEPAPLPHLAGDAPAPAEPGLAETAPTLSFDLTEHEDISEETPFGETPLGEFPFGEEADIGDAPPAELPIFAQGPRSELRARLVREDLTLARPQPSRWRKFVIMVRRLYWGRAD